MATTLPSLPYREFPLRPHRNGQWFKSVWNARLKRSEQFYFGSWRDDPMGDAALNDPVVGWLARRPRIKQGIDHLTTEAVPGELCLGDLMRRYLEHNRTRAAAGDLSLRTLGDHLREVNRFVTMFMPSTPVTSLAPEHFSQYMRHMVEERKLGRYARKRVRNYITALFRFGAKNGWYRMPNTGVDWVVPATDPDSMRLARARAGLPDHSRRVVTGEEIDRLLERAQPAFRAMILLGINAGLGPADIGRMRWNMIDMASGRLVFPRGKTGAMRVGYLWKKTRSALRRVKTLKHNQVVLERDGEAALVFVTRKGLAYYREAERIRDVEVNGHKVKKLVGVTVENAVSITFRRMTKELGIKHLGFYRLRHSFKTYAKHCRDREALDLAMGHKDLSIGKAYDHETISFSRTKCVAKSVYRRLWQITKPKGSKSRPSR